MMGHILLWVSALVAALLTFATALTCRHYLRNWHWLLITVGLVLPVSLPALLFAETLSLQSTYRIPPGWTLYFGLWLAVYAAGAVLLCCKAGIRCGDDSSRWPAGRLAAATGFFLALVGVTIWNLDTNARETAATLRAEINARIHLVEANRPPAASNAAPLYHEAFEMLTHVLTEANGEDDVINIWEQGAGLDYAHPAFTKTRSELQPVLALVRSAAAMPACDFERNYSMSFGMLLPELPPLRTAARWLRYDAVAAARQGGFDRALENVLAQLRIAQHIADEPILISVLVGMSIQDLARETMEDILSTGIPDAKALALLDAMPYTDFKPQLARAIRQEAVLGLSLFAQISDGSVPLAALVDDRLLGDLSPPVFLSYWRIFMLRDEIHAYREPMLQYSSLAAQPYLGTKDTHQALEERFSKKPPGIVVSLLLPELNRIPERSAKAAASHRLIRISKGILAYRNRTGQWPKTPQDLTTADLPFMLLDPFTGTPISWERSGQRILLRALGPDGRPDTLPAGKEKHRNEGDDVTLAIPLNAGR